jgi:hypothetical protein
VLTAEGRRSLFERLNEFSEADASSEDAFHLRVGLFAGLKPEVRETILSRREKYLQNRDAKLAVLQEKMELGKFGGEIVGRMRKQIKMDREWMRHLRRIAKAEGRKEGR